MKIDSATRKKIEKLPASLKSVALYMIDTIDTIANGECDEKDIIGVVSSIEENKKSRYGDGDLMNYDKAGNALGFGVTNRVGLKNLLDKNGIKQVKINNMKCGFRRSEIMALAARLESERNKANMGYIEKRRKR